MKLNEINLRDPYILTENGVCYLYGTTGGSSSWSGKAQGFDVYVSEDGENFIKKPVFRPNPSFWSDENYWAPEVHKIGGKFFMFASFFRKGEHRKSHILVCDTPDGTFIPLPAPLTPENWDCLEKTEKNTRSFAMNGRSAKTAKWYLPNLTKIFQSKVRSAFCSVHRRRRGRGDLTAETSSQTVPSCTA